MQTQLVHRDNNKAFTTSLVIAEKCPTERKGVEHKRTLKSVVDLIKKYESDFLTHGQIDFENLLNPQGKDTVIAHLNEDQATFLITLFTNTKKVVSFKSRLVKEFRKALEEINRLYANPPRTDLITDKRQAHNPMMNALIEFRSEQGKETKPVHYMSENKLCNGVVTGNYSRAYETTMTNEQIILLAIVRRRNESYLMAGLDYQERKKRLLKFVMQHNTKKIEQCY